MASEMRRAARALVETRVETFESADPLEPSRARLEKTLAALGPPRALVLRGAWSERDGHAVFEATFAPAPGTRRFLHGLSAGLVAMLAASAWVFYATGEGAAPRFLLPLFTVLCVVAMPIVVNAVASNREAEESRIRRAIRIALQDADSRFPPQQRWADED